MAGRGALSWDDLRLFLEVARFGGLSAAGRATGMSAATLGRRVTALEAAVGEPLFRRAQTGYRLTEAGEALRARAEEVEGAMATLQRWRDERHGIRVVRVAAGGWTSAFLSRHVGALWTPEDRFRLEFVTANEKVDIGRRHADLGLRNARPTEQWLAGRLIGRVAFALYCAPRMIGGVRDGMFVGLSGRGATPSARWLEAHHHDRIGVRGNDPLSVRELIAAGAGIGVLPCFVGDADERLSRVATPIAELSSEQWLVSHHEERHAPEVRRVADRIAMLMRENAALLRGDGIGMKG